MWFNNFIDSSPGNLKLEQKDEIKALGPQIVC